MNGKMNNFTKKESINFLVFQLHFEKEKLRSRDRMRRDGIDGTGHESW